MVKSNILVSISYKVLKNLLQKLSNYDFSFGQKTIKGDCVFYHSTHTDGKACIVGNTVDVGDEKENLVKVKLSQKILTRGCEPFVLRNNQHYFKGVIVK